MVVFYLQGKLLTNIIKLFGKKRVVSVMKWHNRITTVGLRLYDAEGTAEKRRIIDFHF